MDDSYLEEPSPALSKGVKWLVLLLLLRAKHPARWAAFVALNPVIRARLHRLLTPQHKDPATASRRIDKLANLASVALLYSASAGNARLPKDYISLYLAECYHGTFVPPSSPLVVSPTTGKMFRLQSYAKNSWVRYLYHRKHFVLFPLIYGQILSNYLTPTRYKLNQRYLSSPIKSHVLNPIWRNFRMGVRTQSLDWLGLLQSYAAHSGLLVAYFVATSFKARIYAALTNRSRDEAVGHTARSTVKECVARAIAVSNAVYSPNIWAMLLLSLTAHQLTKPAAFRKYYLANTKQVTKIYVKAVGFAAALLSMSLSHADVVSALVKKHTGSSNAGGHLGAGFYSSVNMYLAHVIVLSKWRIVKENHPWFSVLKVGTWERMESAVMCYLVWQLMNLNNCLRQTQSGTNAPLCRALEAEPVMRAINYIMK